MRFSLLTATATMLACLALLLDHHIHAFSLRLPSVHGRRPAIRNAPMTNNAVNLLGVDTNFDEKKELDVEKKQQEITDMDAAAQIISSSSLSRDVKITWEPQVAELLRRLEQVSNPTRPFMVAIVAIPGAGKSTSAAIIQTILGGQDRVLIMPMDGFHIPLAELAKHENATDVIYRRGAPDTFHAAALKTELHKIAYGGKEISTISIPGFDHSVGDPTPNQYTFHRDSHRIVLCEGLYLLHDNDGWEDIKSIFDWTIYIDANVDTCIERLKERNKCIPGYTPEEIEIRCDAVDRVNAMLVREGAFKYASQIVSSSGA